MTFSSLSHVQIAALAAVCCFMIAIIMVALMAGQRGVNADGQRPGIGRALFKGDSLTAKGNNYRIIVFIALMFAIMNTMATVFIFIATQTRV